MIKGYVYSSRDISRNTTNGHLIDIFTSYSDGNKAALEYRKKYNWHYIWLADHIRYCSQGAPSWHLGET